MSFVTKIHLSVDTKNKFFFFIFMKLPTFPLKSRDKSDKRAESLVLQGFQGRNTPVTKGDKSPFSVLPLLSPFVTKASTGAIPCSTRLASLLSLLSRVTEGKGRRLGLNVKGTPRPRPLGGNSLRLLAVGHEP